MNVPIALPLGRRWRAGARPRSDARPRRRHARRTPSLWIGAALVGALFLAALLAPMLAPAPPDLMQPELRLQPPSLDHPFGTDIFGRDMLSRVLYGARLAVQVSLATVTLAAIPGIALGLLAGFHQGWTDQVLARIMDVWMAFPGLLLAVVLVARLGPSLPTAILALGVIGAPTFFRLTRSSTLSGSAQLYIEAARAVGVSNRRTIVRHLLPNMLSPLIVLITLNLGATLLAVSGLSFIGLGAQPPQPEWGALLAAGRDYMDTAWWLALAPGLAITLSVMGFNLLGDGLRDILGTRQN